MTRVLKRFMEDGTKLLTLLPLSHRTAHINRFGDYILDMSRQALRPDYRLRY